MTMKIDPRHLLNLLAIADHGSFNRAAAALGISQPALSSSIAQLERRLGFTVLDRSRRGSEINEYGGILLQGARVLEAVLAQSAEQLRLKRQGIEGPLRIGATPSMAIKFMPELMAALLKARGAVEIALTEGLDDELVAALRSGALDLVLGTSLGSGLPGDLIEETLFDDTFAIGVGPQHELAKRRSLTLAELRDHPWVLPGPGSAYRRYVEALFLTAGIPWPQDHVVSNSLPLVESIVALTGRVTIVTQMQVTRHNVWRLRAIPLRGAGRRSLSVKWRRTAQMSPLAKRVVELAHSAGL
jgi:LysR family transcriptional regulator, regulator for genes of the gallate degradation pathway